MYEEFRKTDWVLLWQSWFYAFFGIRVEETDCLIDTKSGWMKFVTNQQTIESPYPQVELLGIWYTQSYLKCTGILTIIVYGYCTYLIELNWIVFQYSSNMLSSAWQEGVFDKGP